MRDGGNETTLGALCDAGIAHIQTGPFGSQLHSYDYQPEGTPVVPTEAIGKRRLQTNGIPRVSALTANRLSRHRLKRGDILFARRGVQATGLSAIIEAEHEGWLCGTGAILLRFSSPKVDPTFVSFLLSGDAAISWLKAHAVGAVMPNLNETVLRRLPMHLPPINEQRAIARVLSALDAKIELNRRMNETLEAMAQALFKSWFIDFDPVHAKAAGRKLAPELHHLFPDAFQPSPLGDIPQGWGVQPISSFCLSVENGGTPKRMQTEFWNGDIPWFKTGELTDGPLVDSEEKITRLGLNNSACSMWDVGTILVALYASPTVGRLGILEVEATANQACSALNVKPEFGALFVFYSLFFSRPRLQQIAVGAAQQNINQQVLKTHQIVAPMSATARAFDEAVRPLYTQRVSLEKQSCTLAELRDTLLPKLLSGEVRVRDAEKILEEVA